MQNLPKGLYELVSLRFNIYIFLVKFLINHCMNEAQVIIHIKNYIFKLFNNKANYSPKNPGMAPKGITNKLTNKSAMANDNKK